jgi:hypothetical protein
MKASPLDMGSWNPGSALFTWLAPLLPTLPGEDTVFLLFGSCTPVLAIEPESLLILPFKPPEV